MSVMNGFRTELINKIVGFNSHITIKSFIPKIDLKSIKDVIGKDTISAVRSGFFWGYAGLIDNIIRYRCKISKPFMASFF